MEIQDNYIIPYIISNVVALLMCVLAYKKPNISRLLYIILFGWASVTNFTTALKTPEVYLEYADFTFSYLYKNFITEFFSDHITSIVILIAACQLFIAILLFTKHLWLKLALIAGILFFVGIAPLGVGAAFPSSLIWALGLFFLYRKKLNRFRFRELLKS